MTAKLKWQGADAFVSSVIIVAIGLVSLWEGIRHPMGQLRQIGPGLFPAALGVLLIVMGGVVFFEKASAENTPDEPEAEGAKGIVATFSSLVVFAALIETAGLGPACFACAVTASLASRPWKPLFSVVLGVSVATLVTIVFVYGLGMSLKII